MGNDIGCKLQPQLFIIEIISYAFANALTDLSSACGLYRNRLHTAERACKEEGNDKNKVAPTEKHLYVHVKRVAMCKDATQLVLRLAPAEDTY
ncbi:hypothetical protein BaRGS_00015145 [Batillaria attramentaria]|uniref:Uncharacterized protein n=1 Tax=Batillaria attramentaria TaxID=370345 RepID=A0ABD0L2T0_9CAEN